MGRQSDTLAAETAVMRAFDRALQAAAELPPKAVGRVLRYVGERVADELAAHTQQSQAGNGTVAGAGHLGGAGSVTAGPG